MIEDFASLRPLEKHEIRSVAIGAVENRDVMIQRPIVDIQKMTKKHEIGLLMLEYINEENYHYKVGMALLSLKSGNDKAYLNALKKINLSAERIRIWTRRYQNLMAL